MLAKMIKEQQKEAFAAKLKQDSMLSTNTNANNKENIILVERNR